MKLLVVLLCIFSTVVAEPAVKNWETEIFIRENNDLHISETILFESIINKIGFVRLVPNTNGNTELLNPVVSLNNRVQTVELVNKNSFRIKASNPDKIKLSMPNAVYRFDYDLRNFTKKDSGMHVLSWESAPSYLSSQKQKVKITIVLPKQVDLNQLKSRSSILDKSHEKKADVKVTVFKSDPAMIQFESQQPLESDQGMHVDVLYPVN